MPGDAEPAGASGHGADRDVDGWVGLHCGRRERGSCAAASTVQRRDPGRRQAPRRQDPTSRPDHVPPPSPPQSDPRQVEHERLYQLSKPFTRPLQTVHEEH